MRNRAERTSLRAAQLWKRGKEKRHPDLIKSEYRHPHLGLERKQSRPKLYFITEMDGISALFKYVFYVCECVDIMQFNT